ncbi:MAG: hypothetical protein KDD48_04745 [Bdellovibrionales bacterium]|nr:hypothetical protein [Bdellovibrionales bacterium]
MDKRKSALIQAAIAGVLTAGTVTFSSSVRADDVKCYGINNCKAQGACGSAKTGKSCAGSNDCKGHGFLNMPEADCIKKGGRLTEDAKKQVAKKVHKGKVKAKKAKHKSKKIKKAAEKPVEDVSENTSEQ